MSFKSLLAIGLTACTAVWTSAPAQQPEPAAAAVRERAARGWVTGTVTIDGEPAIGLTMILQSGGGCCPTEPPRTTVDAQGRYRFDDVEAGYYQVFAYQCGLIRTNGVSEQETIHAIEVKPGAVTEVREFAFTPGGYIRGRVVDSDGKPVERECVSVIALDEKGQPLPKKTGVLALFGVTNRNGEYRLCGVRAGRYFVQAGCESPNLLTGGVSPQRLLYPGTTETADATPVEVVANGGVEGIDFTLGHPTGLYAISGRFVDATTDQPIAGVQVMLGASHEGGASSRGQGVTDADGAFRIGKLRPGDYTLAIWGEGETASRYVSTPVDVKVEATDVTTVIKLERATSISGVVVVENGGEPGALEALRGLRVRPVEVPSVAPGKLVQMEFAPIDGENRFRLGSLPGGKVQLMLAEGNRSFWVRSVELGGEDVATGITVKPGQPVTGARIVVRYGTGSIRGRIEVRNGILPPDSEAIVSIKPPEPWGPLTSPGLWSATADETGVFVVEGLLPGDYLIQPMRPTDERGRSWSPTEQEPIRVTVGDHATAEVVVVADFGRRSE